LNVLLNIFHN